MTTVNERIAERAVRRLSLRWWNRLHYSGQGGREFVFDAALLQAVKVGMQIERDRIDNAIEQHELQERSPEQIKDDLDSWDKDTKYITAIIEDLEKDEQRAA